MKKIFILLFLLISASAFAESIFGHWDVVSENARDHGCTISFYQDYTYVVSGADGEIQGMGNWEYTDTGVYFIDIDAYLDIKWIDDNNCIIGVPNSGIADKLVKQEGV